MKLHFYKYQGTGNDFILLDNRDGAITLNTQQIARLCDRRFGIGADGLMLLEQSTGYDFRMVYYNADGNESTMCGNGGRCITAFAKKLGIVEESVNFLAIDGKHHATFHTDGTISLHMQDVTDIINESGHTILNTGSPHYVVFVDDVQTTDVFAQGRSIRNQQAFQPKGINVNFVQQMSDGIWVRTYERGVEDETLSCGTGVTASAIAYHNNDSNGHFSVNIKTPGGKLNVRFDKDSLASAKNVVLTGPATYVYEGDVVL